MALEERLHRQEVLASFERQGYSNSHARNLTQAHIQGVSLAQVAARNDMLRKRLPQHRALSILLNIECFRQNISLTELSKSSGIKKSTLSYIVMGRSLPSEETAEKLFSTLGLPKLDFDALKQLYKSNLLGQAIHQMYSSNDRLEDFNGNPEDAFSYLVNFERVKRGLTQRDPTLRRVLGLASNSFRRLKTKGGDFSYSERRMVLDKLGYVDMDVLDIGKFFVEGKLEDYMLSH